MKNETREIGTRFNYNGKRLLVVKSMDDCAGCYFLPHGCLDTLTISKRGWCGKEYRADGEDVIFVENNKKL